MDVLEHLPLIRLKLKESSFRMYQKPIPASKFPAPQKEPLSYPGERPSYSYLLCDRKVFEIVDRGAWHTTDGNKILKDWDVVALSLIHISEPTRPY